ncbi:MAG: preprotein translocase subunit YajC [Clostridia bacterium]|nr:preprotein translocase subunit YajC [Clostridia bacterium]
MNKILNFVDLLAESTSTSSDANANNGSSIWVYVVMIVLVVLMLVLPAITQRKRNKEYTQMLDSLNVGDTIKTIGGVIGRVTKITEKDGQKSFILETGAKGNKTTMEFDIASVAYIVSSTAKKVEEPKVEEKKEENAEAAAAESETAPAEPAETPQENKAPAKKTTAKKSTSKKSSNKKA